MGVDVVGVTAWTDLGAGLQHVLDTATELQALRKQLLTDVDRRGVPTRPGTSLVGIGRDTIRRELLRFARHNINRELHSTHPTCAITEESFHHDKAFRSSGGTMVSLYNPAGTAEEKTQYLTDDVLAECNHFAPSPVQMIILDRSTLIIEGPEFGGERSALAVTDRALLMAAWKYWHSLRPIAVPVLEALGPDPLVRFSQRQREIVHLLADDHTDQAIATRLDLSLRTVQYEVAAIMRLLNVRSRFGAGMAIGRLGLNR